MTTALLARRLTVLVGIAIVLVLVVGAIRLAAVWTAAAAPLTVAPASATQLTAGVMDEQARGEALTRQLAELEARSQDLAVALGQARDRIAADAAHATELKDKLATAKSRLATLEKELARARQAVSRPSAPRATTTVARSSAGEHEDEGEHGD